jgi:hypothetical protein
MCFYQLQYKPVDVEQPLKMRAALIELQLPHLNKPRGLLALGLNNSKSHHRGAGINTKNALNIGQA